LDDSGGKLTHKFCISRSLKKQGFLEIHQDIYEHFDIIPIIIRKKMVYPKGFTKDGFPVCPWGTPMKPKGIEYDRKRTKYACFKAYQESEQMLPLCDYLKEQYSFGYICHTYFTSGYRKFGPALPHNAICQKLKPLRTGNSVSSTISRSFTIPGIFTIN
jgi:hypothetical protein